MTGLENTKAKMGTRDTISSSVHVLLKDIKLFVAIYISLFVPVMLVGFVLPDSGIGSLVSLFILMAVYVVEIIAIFGLLYNRDKGSSVDAKVLINIIKVKFDALYLIFFKLFLVYVLLAIGLAFTFTPPMVGGLHSVMPVLGAIISLILFYVVVYQLPFVAHFAMFHKMKFREAARASANFLYGKRLSWTTLIVVLFIIIFAFSALVGAVSELLNLPHFIADLLSSFISLLGIIVPYKFFVTHGGLEDMDDEYDAINIQGVER